MNYQEISKQIIDLLGGESNVKDLQHCATRLRFKIKDMNKIDTEGLNKLSGIAGIKKQSEGIHVIIGQDVDEVYDEIIKNYSFIDTNDNEGHSEQQSEKKKNVFMRVMNTVADCLVPALPALIAAGLMNAVITLSTYFGLVSETSETYSILYLMAQAPIYFLPFMVAVGAAKRFKTNTFLAIAVTAILLYPTFTTLGGEATSISFLGLPVRLVDYSSQLVPIILLCWAQSYIEKLVSKVVPKAISVFMNPLLTYIIVAVLALTVFGPIGSYLGDVVTMAVESMVGKYNWLFGLLFAGFGNFLVASGMHYGLIPIVIANFAVNGYDNFYAGACFAGAMALSGAVLALVVKSKNKDVKGIAGTTGFTALLGISEPALYGVFFRYKSVMIATTVAGAIGGCLAGIIGVNSYGMAPAGLTSIAVLVGPTFMNAIIVMVLSFIIGFGLSFIMYKDEVSGEVIENESK